MTGLKNLRDKLRLLHRQYCIVTVSIVIVDDYEILWFNKFGLVINVTAFNISLLPFYYKSISLLIKMEITSSTHNLFDSSKQ